jgi:hypothetical protein
VSSTLASRNQTSTVRPLPDILFLLWISRAIHGDPLGYLHFYKFWTSTDFNFTLRSLVFCFKGFQVICWSVMTDFNQQDPARRTVTDSRPPVASFENPLQESPQHSHQLSSASSYADLNYLFGVQDPTMLAPKPNRNRRKSNQGAEHTKHRRTRSGCYTCRSRRVKVLHNSDPSFGMIAYIFQCDETHPICERKITSGSDMCPTALMLELYRM